MWIELARPLDPFFVVLEISIGKNKLMICSVFSVNSQSKVCILSYIKFRRGHY